MKRKPPPPGKVAGVETKVASGPRGSVSTSASSHNQSQITGWTVDEQLVVEVESKPRGIT